MKFKNNILENVIYSAFTGIAVAAITVAFFTAAPVAVVISIGAAVAAAATEIGLTANDHTPPKFNVPSLLVSAAATAALSIALLPQAKPQRESIKNLFSDAAVVQTHDASAKLDAKTTYVYKA